MGLWRRLLSACTGSRWLLTERGLRQDVCRLQTELAQQRLELVALQLQGQAEFRLQGQAALSQIQQQGAALQSWLQDNRDLERAQFLALQKQLLDLLQHVQFLTCLGRADVVGHTMYLDPTDEVVSPMLLRDGCYEPFETEVIKSVVKPGDVVVDLGANVGYFTLLLARLVGETGKVIAFEPDPHNFGLLRKNIRANGYRNVVLHQQAVGQRSGTQKLFLCEKNRGDHRLYDSQDGRATVDVSVTTIDQALGKGQRVDFIKMDIQGCEPGALQGMQETLRHNPGVKMITEFWPEGLSRYGVEPEDYWRQLTRCGFHLWHMDGENQQVVAMTAAQALAAYTVERQNYANFFCTPESEPRVLTFRVAHDRQQQFAAQV